MRPTSAPGNMTTLRDHSSSWCVHALSVPLHVVSSQYLSVYVVSYPSFSRVAASYIRCVTYPTGYSLVPTCIMAFFLCYCLRYSLVPGPLPPPWNEATCGTITGPLPLCLGMTHTLSLAAVEKIFSTAAR